LGWQVGDLPQAEYTCRNILTLPLFPTMTHDDVARVVTTLINVLHAHAK
jgi:dTDP-4-amino-4,6-dideoxygalactose transaminase